MATFEQAQQCGYNDTKHGLETCDGYAKIKYIAEMVEALKSGKGLPGYNAGCRKALRHYAEANGIELDLEGGV